MRDLHETGADEYTWGETIAEVDRVATWLEAEFGEGQRMALRCCEIACCVAFMGSAQAQT